MSETKTTEIGGNTYAVTLFTTSTSIKLLRRLVKVLGPSLAALFEGTSEFSLDDSGPITKAMSLLSDNIDKDDVVELLKDLVKNTRRNGSEINFDIDFRGKLTELFQLSVFIVKENYGNFSELAASVK